MSVVYSNSWNGNKMYQTSENFQKYVDTGEIVNSKIRKFFFILQDKEIERDLRVTISVSSGDKVGDQIILIELTNDANPVFLFLLTITKADFEILKKDQGLNVEFQNFPQALVNLLEQCNDGDSETGGRFKLMLVDYCGTAAGCRIMDMNKIQIKIVEECTFRNIIHLTLDVLRGSELQIRQKLEAEVYKIKQSLLKTSKSHDDLLIKISELVEQLNEKNTTIEKANITANDLIMQKEEECLKVRSQAERQEKLLRDEFNEKISEERKQFEKQQLQMQSKIDILEKELRSFHEKELEMQSLLHEKERDKELIEVELISKKQEINQLRSQNEKLDCDYHDKDKSVNILRTRLAVAEQELKDNNTLLLNHQNKLDEVIKDKINFQAKVDVLLNKLDKKEVALKNLSDEIMKANDIIAKQQLKLNIFSSKLKEYESSNSKLEQTITAKDVDLSKQLEVVNKLQGELALVITEADRLKEKVNFLERKETELNNLLISKSKTVASLRENFDDLVNEVQLNAPQKSLLTSRLFLSMPSLLPSDYYRHTNELWNFMLQYQTPSDNDLYQADPATKSFKFLRIIKPYIYRYLKRFQSKSLDTPLTVLVSPQELQSQGRHLRKGQSQENINKVTEYAIYNATTHYSTVQSDTSIDKVKSVMFNKPVIGTHNKTKIVKTDVAHRPVNNASESRESKSFGLGEGSSKPPPNYAPVGAFRLKPFERVQRMTSAVNCGANQRYSKGEGQSAIPSNLRKTPAVSAPPLTPEQRNADSVFKTSRSRWIGNQKNFNMDTPHDSTAQPMYKSTGEYKKLSTPRTLSETSTVNHSKPSYSQESIKDMFDCLSISQTSKIRQKFFESESIACNRNNGLMLKPFNKSEAISASKIDNSIDLPEPSAYFAI